MGLNRPIGDVTKADLDALIDNQIPESTTLEYKESLPLDKPEEKKEFVRDISAFANTHGGDIIYGVREDKERGIPKELCGIPLANPDRWKQCLENLLRDGTSPRIYGIQIGNPVPVGNERVAVVIRIPRSFHAPHMVVCGGDDRFYYRTSTARPRLDVTGLRMLFGMGDTVAARAQAFQAERLSKIQEGHAPVPLVGGPQYVLHLVPFDAFTAQAHYDLSWFSDHPVELARAGRWLASCGFERSRYNFDGLVVYFPHSRETEPREWYIQCFRNGIIEIVTMERNRINRGEGEEPIMIEYEGWASSAVKKYLKMLGDMGVAPPVFVLLTLLGVKGHKLSRSDPDCPGVIDSSFGDPFKEDNLVLPEIVMEDFECDVSKKMEPAFEIVWNAAGLPRRGTT
jgi:hypothetical protein